MHVRCKAKYIQLFYLLVLTPNFIEASASCFATLRNQLKLSYTQTLGTIDTKNPYRTYIETAKPKYKKSEGFLKWGDNIIPFQGWKFHLSCDENNMAHIMSLLPELRKRNIKHKIIESKEKYSSMLSDPSDANRGKFLTIYPKDDTEASELALWINRKLEEMKVEKSDTHRTLLINSNLSRGDLPLGKSGLFYARYGRLGGQTVDIEGKYYVEAFVNGKRHLVPYSPRLDYQIIDPTGKTVPDSRVSVPSWLEIPPGIGSLRAN